MNIGVSYCLLQLETALSVPTPMGEGFCLSHAKSIAARAVLHVVYLLVRYSHLFV